MTQDTRIALLLLGELIAAIRVNDPETFKQWLCGGIKDMGRAVVEKLIIEWKPFADRRSVGQDCGLAPRSKPLLIQKEGQKPLLTSLS